MPGRDKFTLANTRGKILGAWPRFGQYHIAEAQQRVQQKLQTAKGYSVEWVEEFENQVRTTGRLGQVVPISIAAIFVILFVTFGNAKDAGLVLFNVPFALIGGILALNITGMNFGISAGVGFIALFGICIQHGVMLISVFNQNQKTECRLMRLSVRAFGRVSGPL